MKRIKKHVFLKTYLDLQTTINALNICRVSCCDNTSVVGNLKITMAHNFFISHANNDKDVAEIIARIIERITLRQILPWYSSDTSSTGGLKPGSIWFNEIIAKLIKSRAIVAVLTPNSINRHWIYFESGIGEALDDCEVIPICIGVKRDSILPPLGMYQCYQLTDYRSLKEFCGKLLNKFDISFDEEMSQPILEKAIHELSQISFNGNKNDKNEDSLTRDVIDDLKAHIDKRFIEILNDQQKNKNDSNIWSKKISSILYTITIKINFPEYKKDEFVEVRNTDTVAHVFDSIWYLLSNYVEPFTYLKNWILIDYVRKRKLIIKEVATMIPASIIFRPEIIWQVEKLDEEYKGSDSDTKK